jgi:hypothetical protein
MEVSQTSPTPNAQELGATMSEERRRWVSQSGVEVGGGEREREREGENLSLSSSFLFCLNLQQIGWCLPTLVREELLYLVTDSMFVSSGNTFTDTPRNNAFSAIWVKLSSSSQVDT